MKPEFLIVFTFTMMISVLSFAGKRKMSDKQITLNSFTENKLQLTAGDVLHINKTVDHEGNSLHLNNKLVCKPVGNGCGMVNSYTVPTPGPAVITFKNYDLTLLQTSSLLPGGQLFILTDF
jgi:hypothetical protein